MDKVSEDGIRALIADTPTPSKARANSATRKLDCAESSSPISPTTAGDSSLLSDGSPSPSTPGADEVFVSMQCLDTRLESLDARDVLRQDLESEAKVEDDSRVYWEGFFVNMSMFCGYASLFGLQHEIKSKFAISDNNISESRTFGVAVSFLYIFNLIFRFSHNIVFGWVGPRGRTYLAMMSMMASMLIIAIPIFFLDCRNLGWVMLAYALGGVAVGTFEANFLCCLTPLGPRTKHVAITAIPVGITAVLVGAFFAMGPPFYVPARSIYLAVATSVFCAMFLFAIRIPHKRAEDADMEVQGLQRFVMEVRQWRDWLPLVWHLPVATAVDMFTLSAFSPGVALYIYDAKTVNILPGLSLPNPDFFVVYNTFNMLGGLCGRILSYRIKPRHPILYTAFNILGVVMLLTRIPVIAPLSTFLVMVGDGLIYGSIARRIDATVPKQFNLVALSFWLFVGDFGSVLGSNLISYIRVWVVGH